ncbi:Ribonucleoprotein LSM domain eukaryotic/archaea-type [Penicillium viridicatum]|nr:Ribonucleoprotein LSM domain eukaryotic/archaea-type [Penicillium viridicatum]
MASGTNAVVCPPEVRRSSLLQLNHKARGIPNRKRTYELTNLLNFANPPNNPTLSFFLRRNHFQLSYPQTSTPPHIGCLLAADTNNAPTTMDHDQSVQYLEGLLGRTLRIHTTDTRMFVGLFKCTDADRNIILANSFEYRMPTTSAVQAAAEEKQSWGEGSEAKSTTVKVNMTHRLIGLIVIPGRHITKIELE